MPDERLSLPIGLTVSLLSVLILLRTLVGLHPHSGQNDDHSGLAAYGGDYEAQRHWMEITVHLPLSSWYHHDTDYWGLDYPPLTAYVSLICGWGAEMFAGKESVALYASRGWEEEGLKSFMRLTVLVMDVMIYFPAVWVVSSRLFPRDRKRRVWTIVLALSQPALVLIDHGHFQYNTVALGLSLWSFHFMTKEDGPFLNCLVGSVFFCMALNFKQMTLYYAPAVFFYLLGRCAANDPGPFRWKTFWSRFVMLGVTVIFSFALLWWPVVASSPSKGPAILHILHRIFPFERGLFEGKVANLWCALSTSPVNIRTRLPQSLQPAAALVLTITLALPSSTALLFVGRDPRVCHLRCVLWGAAASGLAFFLASFQVHEKSILMAAAPLSLLIMDSPAFVGWFLLSSSWSLFSLLTVDRLRPAYAACMILFIVLVWMAPRRRDIGPLRGFDKLSEGIAIPASYGGMVVLHALEFAVPAPPGLPDLFPVLWSVAGCAAFVWAWGYCSWTLIQGTPIRAELDKLKRS